MGLEIIKVYSLDFLLAVLTLHLAALCSLVL